VTKLFPKIFFRIQGWIASLPMLPAHIRREFTFPFDRSDDGGSKPSFGRISVSPASLRIISLDGSGFAERFSEGVFSNAVRLKTSF
jgi:hypothetical protein